MDKIFEAYEFKYIWRTFWFVPGRVYGVDLHVDDVLSPLVVQSATISTLKFRIVAIETYGRALDLLSAGMSGQLILQLPNDKQDEMVKQLPANVKLTAVE